MHCRIANDEKSRCCLDLFSNMRTVNLSRTKRLEPLHRAPQNKTSGAGPEVFALKKFLSVSEVVVHAEAQKARMQAVVHAGDRVGAACEIHV